MQSSSPLVTKHWRALIQNFQALESNPLYRAFLEVVGAGGRLCHEFVIFAGLAGGSTLLAMVCVEWLNSCSARSLWATQLLRQSTGRNRVRRRWFGFRAARSTWGPTSIIRKRRRFTASASTASG